MSDRLLIVRDSAKDDVKRQARMIARSGRRVAERFLDNFEATCQSINEQPHLGSPWEFADDTTAHLRFRPVKKYPHHLIFYFVQTDSVVVVRVFHSSQDIQSELRIDVEDH